MKKNVYLGLLLVLFGSLTVGMVSTVAYATNGMNLEGYGPIATGMGGASMAYDNGDAAMMNNPATLGLMPQGDRLDVALGFLGPHIKADMMGLSANSTANAFYMPAFGWVRKSGQFSYGAGLFSQGGMGTEYDAASFLAAGSGQKVRSEVGVGRILFPVAYEVNKNLSIGGSVDYVWASMDIKMALTGGQFFDMAGAFGGSQTFGSVSGSMIDKFASVMPALDMMGPNGPVNWGRFDFSDDSNFTGKAKGQGFAAKLGGVYKLNDTFSVGGAYHSKTRLNDLEANGATVSFNVNIDPGALMGTPTGNFVPMTIPVTGKIKVKNFEWPQMLATGIAYQASDKLMIVFDYKWINWKATMKDFQMVFTADINQPGLAAGFAGTVLNTVLVQKWKDQNVFMLGASYKMTDNLTLRAGLNIANNPIPDTYLNPLFPAIIKNHIIIGAGYAISKASTVDASFTYAPEVKATNGQFVSVAHKQMNGQLMYSHRF